MFKWSRGTQLLADIIEPGFFTEDQMKGLLDTVVTKLTQIAKDAVAELHIVPTKSINSLITRIFELDCAPRGEGRCFLLFSDFSGFF